MKIAILDDYQRVALQCADWTSLGRDAQIESFSDYIDGEDAVAAALADFDVAVAMRERTRFPATLLERLGGLKLLVTSGMRNQAIDMVAAREQDITVCGTEMLGYPAAEHAWALVMGLTKKISLEDQAMHEGRWQVAFSEGLKGQTLGLFGLGKLGAQMARYGNAFGMDVIAWSENLTDARAEECGAARVDKKTLFSKSDMVSIHVVLSDRTRGSVGREELGLMKPTAYLVNTSRGPVIDESALIAALEQRRIAGAGLDVYDVEPLPTDHPLRNLDNTVLTGHTGYVVRENYELAYGQAVEDIRAWRDGTPVRVLNAK